MILTVGKLISILEEYDPDTPILSFSEDNSEYVNATVVAEDVNNPGCVDYVADSLQKLSEGFDFVIVIA